MQKSVGIVGVRGIPAEYGGFETTAEAIAVLLQDRWAVTVFCSAQQKTRKQYRHVSLRFLPIPANGIWSLIYDTVSLFLARHHNAVIILGVSGAWFLPAFRVFSRARIIINVDGMEWRREKWSLGSRLLLRFLEKCAIQNAHEVVADNAAIQDYVRQKYEIEAHLIPYGGDPIDSQVPRESIPWNSPVIPGTYWLALARIEPENNVEMILEAFIDSGQELVFLGNWANTPQGVLLRKRFGNVPNIMLLDPIYDRSIVDLLRQGCIAYLHGHSAGGTNPSLVEAMYSEAAVIAFDCVFNRETTEDEALYFSSSSDLRELVENLDNETLRANGAKMKAIADRRYSWRRVVDQYEKLLLRPRRRHY